MEFLGSLLILIGIALCAAFLLWLAYLIFVGIGVLCFGILSAASDDYDYEERVLARG